MILGVEDPFTSASSATLGDLAALLPNGRVIGRFARGGCPVCESATGAWAAITQDGDVRVGCFGCDDWRSLRTALGLDGAGARARTRFVHPRCVPRSDAPDMVADADALDRVYRVLARHLAMSADQRRNVLGRDRHLPPELRERVGALLGPVPVDSNVWVRLHQLIVSDLLKVAPLDFLRRVPEFSARRDYGLAVLHTRREALYFEPWRDERGRIVALRAYMGKRAEPKYLTTGGRWGPLVHFAFGVEREAVGSAPWIFTEAWMKAEVLAYHIGAVGVGFAGVNQKRSRPRAIEALQRLAPDAPTYIAFDAEIWTTRLDLAIPALQLARAIEDATGRPAGFAVWDTTVGGDGRVEPKGIDDAITAGREVRLVDRAAFAAYLGPTLEAWENAVAA